MFDDRVFDDSRVLHAGELDGVSCVVRENDTYRWIETDDGAVQSVVNLSNVTQIVMPVMQRLMTALAIAPEPRRVLNLGAGGGTLERALHRNRPDIVVTSVEESSDMLAIARTFMSFPMDMEVLITSAENFIETSTENFDVIFCDLFRGRSQPECLTQAVFYRTLQEHLASNGVYAANYSCVNTADLVSLLKPLRKCFTWTSICKIDRFDNVCVFASSCPPPDWGNLRSRLDRLNNEFNIDLSGFTDDLEILPERHTGSDQR